MKLNRFIKFMIKQRDRYRQQFRINPEQVDVGFVIKRPDATEFVFLDPDKTDSGCDRHWP